MISLAPVRYANILRQNGGPLARIEMESHVLYGKQFHSAYAYLADCEGFEAPATVSAVSMPDGAGTAGTKQIACHMAISEALERWAVHYSRAFPDKISCGIDFDSSSNGFAAFPGLFKRQARKAAFQESIERHCLISWWEGLLQHHHLKDPSPGIRAVQLDNPFSGHEVALIWKQDSMGRYVFGFGAADNLNKAVWRALVEQSRTAQVLDNLGSVRAQDYNTYDRRIRYFSSPRGASAFLDRLGAQVTGKPDKLSLLFDQHIPGPWDRFASVWRTVVKPPSEAYLSDREDYFFW